MTRKTSVHSLVLCGVLLGCSAPSESPHQPITGVDRPREDGAAEPVRSRDPDPGLEPLAEPAPRSPSRASDPFEQMVDRLSEAHAAAPGPVAVFPATSSIDGGPRTVNGLGEDLARRTAEALRERGVDPVWESELLRQRLSESNRDPRHLTAAGVDPYALARRIGARYVVFGSADEGFDGPRMDRDDYFSLRWRARSLDDGSVLASMDQEQRRADSRFPRSHRLARRAASWPTGNPSPPRLIPELQYLGRQGIAALVAESDGLLDAPEEGELRVAVLPTELPRTLQAQRQLLVFAHEFEKAREQLEGRFDPEAALEQPARVGSQQYGRLADALDDYRLLRRELRSSELGELSMRLADQFAEELRRQPGLSLRATPDDLTETAILGVIRSEARRYEHEATIDPETIAWFESEGSQLMLRSAVEQGPQGYFTLHLQLTRLDSGRTVSQRVRFESRFEASLSAEIGR